MPKTASSQDGGSSLFGHMFDAKSSSHPSGGAVTAQSQPQSQVASGDSGTQDHPSFFGSLFKPKNDAATAPPPNSQGVVLAGLPPVAETPKSVPAKSEPSKAEPQVADVPKPKTKAQPGKSQQDATAAPPANTGGVIKGAQPVVPAGTFQGRWALQ
jgi:hypothetical protein